MFGFRFDKRTIFIVLGVMVLFWLMRNAAIAPDQILSVVMAVLWLMKNGTAELLDLLYTLPGILIALTFHEYAHAFAADKLRR